jgi:hypothetical protein
VQPVSCVPGVRRVHSRYERRLLDTAAGGREVLICLTVRRFLCQAPACPKTTFAEQVSGLTSRHPRRTPGLSCVLEAVGLALAAWPYAPPARPRCTGCSVIAAARPRSPPGSSRNTVRRFRTRRRSRRAHRPRLPTSLSPPARRASCTTMSPTREVGGSPAAPTRRCCGRRSAPEATPVATPASGITSPISAETPVCPPRPQNRGGVWDAADFGIPDPWRTCSNVSPMLVHLVTS